MRTLPVLICFALLAGCTAAPEESTVELAENERARGISLSIPPEVERIEVEIQASSREMVSMRAELEREDRSDLAEERFTLASSNATVFLRANVSGLSEAWVLVVADGGDASLTIVARGITADNKTEVLRVQGFSSFRNTTADGSNASP